MKAYDEIVQETKAPSAVSPVALQRNSIPSPAPFTDNRPEEALQRQLQATADSSPRVSQSSILQQKANQYTHQSKATTIQRAATDIPTSVHVNFLAGKYANPNFKLTVVNIRQRNGENIGGILPNNGQVKESVENKGNLKGDTQHSGWKNTGRMIDSHSIPRSLLCGGSSDNRVFIAGETIASQLFLYKDGEVGETVIPKSGFEIRYTNKVYKSDGSLVEAQGKVKVEKGMYSIFEMEKRPAHVVANGHETQPGSGGTKVVKWKIEQPEEKSLIWPVSEIKS